MSLLALVWLAGCQSGLKYENPYGVQSVELLESGTTREGTEDQHESRVSRIQQDPNIPEEVKPEPEVPGPARRKDDSLRKGSGPYEDSYFTVIDGARIHFRWIRGSENQGNAGRYLLIHGFAASTYSYRHTIEHLRKRGNEILALDLPGYGYSDRIIKGNQSSFRRARIVWELIRRVEAARSAKSGQAWILVGHSMGGSVITAMAELQPDKVEYLVYLAGSVQGGPGPITRTALGWIPGLKSIIVWYAESYMFEEEDFRTLLRSAYGLEPKEENVKGYLQPFLIPNTARSILASIEDSRSERPLNPQSIRIPSLLIWGQEDEWVDLEQGYELHRDLHRSILVTIPEAGHCPMETHPELVNGYMDQYHSLLLQMRKINH